jgi:hypothetical protein
MKVYMIKLWDPNKGTVSGVWDPIAYDHIAERDGWSNRLICLYLTVSSAQTFCRIAVSIYLLSFKQVL